MPLVMMQIGIALAIILGLLLTYEIAFRQGQRIRVRRSRDSEKEEEGASGALQGALLGFLGLLLGFSFAGAAGRFLERQELIAKEANAIGTAFLRADLLDEPYRKQMKDALAEYTHHRVNVTQTMSSEPVDLAAEFAKVGEYHGRIWAAARDGSLAKPIVLNVVINVANEVLDIHDERVAAARKHLPTFLLTLLCICSVLSISTLGVQGGLTGKRSMWMSVSVIVLSSSLLWATLDLDHPRLGLMRVSDLPLQELNFKR